MKRLLFVTLLLAAVSIGIWRARQPQLMALRADAAQARAQLAELDSLRKQPPAEPGETVDPKELERLRALRPELARLRGGIGTLRQRGGQTPEQIEAKAGKVQEEAALIRARREAEIRSKDAQNSIGICLSLATQVAMFTGGTLPQNWSEVRARLPQAAAAQKDRFSYLRKVVERESGPQGMLAQFEILPTHPEIRVKLGEPEPPIPFIRELQPRAQPDGGYSRYYAWLDGRTEEVTLADGNFAAWEAEHFTVASSTASTR